MLTRKGYATVFVDGFGVEVPLERIRGTQVQEGDEICKRTLEWLRSKPLTSVPGDASVIE